MISGGSTYHLAVPRHSGQTPTPEQVLHFGSLSLKCGLMPVPSHLWHFPLPPHKEQVFRDMPTSLLLLTRLEDHRAISSISSFAERTERSLSATTPTAVSIAERVVSSVQHHKLALPSSG